MITNHKACVFISSSDNTKDILNKTCATFDKFWSDCPFERYIGVNTDNDIYCRERFNVVTADVSGWRNELLDQIKSIPDDITHIILFLDDFVILSEADSSSINKFVKKCVQSKYKYSRFIPISRSFVADVMQFVLNFIRSDLLIEKVPMNMPYYSSLQVALWERDHLISMLKMNGSIWDFEHQKINDSHHYAVVHKIIDYRHVVEKGKWVYDVDDIYLKIGIPFNKGYRGSVGYLSYLMMIINRYKFKIVGYSVMRLKRKISNIIC